MRAAAQAHYDGIEMETSSQGSAGQGSRQSRVRPQLRKAFVFCPQVREFLSCRGAGHVLAVPCRSRQPHILNLGDLHANEDTSSFIAWLPGRAHQRCFSSYSTACQDCVPRAAADRQLDVAARPGGTGGRAQAAAGHCGRHPHGAAEGDRGPLTCFLTCRRSKHNIHSAAFHPRIALVRAHSAGFGLRLMP